MTKVYIIENNLFESISNKNIPSNIKSRIEKYKVKNDYQNSYIAWYYLNEKLKKDFNINLEKEEIFENEYHKPYIKNIYFNLSHSENLIVIAISNNEVGIDIEIINNNKDYILLKKKLLVDNISNEELIKKWTQIEASFKYDGTGILYSKLNEINIENVSSYKVLDRYNNSYYLSIKTNEEVKLENIK